MLITHEALRVQVFATCTNTKHKEPSPLHMFTDQHRGIFCQCISFRTHFQSAKGRFCIRNRLHLVSDSYDGALRDCVANNASSAWTVHACASVISRSLKSVYPQVNGIQDPCISDLNAVGCNIPSHCHFNLV